MAYRDRTENDRKPSEQVIQRARCGPLTWPPEAARPFLKSVKCRFESDWGHGRRLVGALSGLMYRLAPASPRRRPGARRGSRSDSNMARLLCSYL
jgi:hypothetical protein